ncbi:unnamed protein product [Phaedon cochleariae]|uniref:DUF4806 domain-containing protein n=1 Tax=Phaedon cochleariae TaxID=80249 RepID=A0A9N9SJF3_PHACE|nr:unnamed protein product [Phaedon cochleariae]
MSDVAPLRSQSPTRLERTITAELIDPRPVPDPYRPLLPASLPILFWPVESTCHRDAETPLTELHPLPQTCAQTVSTGQVANPTEPRTAVLATENKGAVTLLAAKIEKERILINDLTQSTVKDNHEISAISHDDSEVSDKYEISFSTLDDDNSDVSESISIPYPTFNFTVPSNDITVDAPAQSTLNEFNSEGFFNKIKDDYMRARNKAKTDEETSDLASEREGNYKRKRIQKVLSSSGSSEESLLPSPPKFKQCYSAGTVIKVDGSGNDTFKKADVSGNESKLEVIIEQNHLIRSITTDLLSKMNAMGEIHDYQKSQGVSIYKDFNLDFPLNSEEDLEKFETVLKEGKNFDAAVNELAKLGGSTNYNFVKRVMTSLIRNEEGSKFSWMGRKGKKPFNKLNMPRLVLDDYAKAKCFEKTCSEEESSDTTEQSKTSRKRKIPKNQDFVSGNSSEEETYNLPPLPKIPLMTDVSKTQNSCILVDESSEKRRFK